MLIDSTNPYLKSKCVRQGDGDGGMKGWWVRGMKEVKIVVVYWFGLNLRAFPSHLTVPREVSTAKNQR